MRPRTHFTSVHTRKFALQHGGKKAYTGQVCWPLKQPSEPWMVLAGDCFFFNLHKRLPKEGLDGCDSPLVLAVRKGTVKVVMDFLEEHLPESAKMLVVHVGAIDLASAKVCPKAAARELIERCSRIRKRRPNLEEIAICLLSYRLPSRSNKYRELFIGWFNQKVKTFNRGIRSLDSRRFSVIDFGLRMDYDCYSNLPKQTGSGPNDSGQELIAGSLSALIKFKRNTSFSSGRSDHGTFSGENSYHRVFLPRSTITITPCFYQTSGDHVNLSLPLPESPYSQTEISQGSDHGIVSGSKKRRLGPEPHDGLKKFRPSDSSDDSDSD